MRPRRRSPRRRSPRTTPPASSTRAARRAGRRARVNSHRAILALVQLNLFNGVRGMLAAAARGGAARPRRRRAPPCALVTTPALPRLGPLHRRGDDARGRREDGAARRPLRSRRRDAPDRARAGHELGADGHHGLSRRAPSGAREVRPLERRPDRLRRRADAPGAPGAHPRGVPERAAQPRPRLRAHRVGRARHDLLRRGAAPPPGLGGAAAADGRDRDPRRRRAARCPRAGGRDPHPQPARDARVLAQARGDEGGAPAAALAAHAATSAASRTGASTSTPARAT